MFFSKCPDLATAWSNPMSVDTCAAFRSSIRRTIPRLVTSLVAAAVMLSISAADAPLRAAEIRLLSAASIQEVFKEVIGDFERASGNKVIIHYGTMGAITEWMRGGEEADLVISSLQSISALVKEGKIEPSSQATIAKVGVGMVVPSGTPAPTLASPTATTDFHASPSRSALSSFSRMVTSTTIMAAKLVSVPGSQMIKPP
jgi:ABC-type molybdate transport system substrate-binding protein